MISETETSDKIDENGFPSRERPANDSGSIKFYGLYWKKEEVNWKGKELFGQPEGWLGQGNIATNFDRESIQMNFWGQKGVYVLYDDSLQPVYAGQAGKINKQSTIGKTIGDRLNEHRLGVYRNGWSLFSWFGFGSVPKFNLRKTENKDRRLKPKWNFESSSENTLNSLLASFEAILIEGFTPRFNARGGDLKEAVLVDQFERNAAK